VRVCGWCGVFLLREEVRGGGERDVPSPEGGVIGVVWLFEGERGGGLGCEREGRGEDVG
jgi:hypothetical protein